MCCIPQLEFVVKMYTVANNEKYKAQNTSNNLYRVVFKKRYYY